MKKILLSILQISVTLGMLWWVFHDHDQRAKMLAALRTADYRWVGAGVLAYLVVEFSAAVRWQILLRVQKIHPQFQPCLRIVFDRDVLQSVSAGRHRG